MVSLKNAFISISLNENPEENGHQGCGISPSQKEYRKKYSLVIQEEVKQIQILNFHLAFSEVCGPFHQR